ncbi:LOW QUALITY PROTEIN: hypothetical protein YC2023_052553 [Brassica napus]
MYLENKVVELLYGVGRCRIAFFTHRSLSREEILFSIFHDLDYVLNKGGRIWGITSEIAREEEGIAGNREGGGGAGRRERENGEEMRKKKRFSLMYSFNEPTDNRRVFSVGILSTRRKSVGFLILAVYQNFARYSLTRSIYSPSEELSDDEHDESELSSSNSPISPSSSVNCCCSGSNTPCTRLLGFIDMTTIQGSFLCLIRG